MYVMCVMSHKKTNRSIENGRFVCANTSAALVPTAKIVSRNYVNRRSMHASEIVYETFIADLDSMGLCSKD